MLGFPERMLLLTIPLKIMRTPIHWGTCTGSASTKEDMVMATGSSDKRGGRRPRISPVPIHKESNLEFGQWTSVFGDTKLTSALVGRLVHHAHILSFTGESFRFKQAMDRIPL